MQRIAVLQSLWSMERRHTDGYERTLEENVRKIAEARFDGISAHCHDRETVRRIRGLLPRDRNYYEGQCFLKTIDELKPVLDIAEEFGVRHIDLHADVRPRQLSECLRLLEGWQRLAEEVDFPVLVETHRDRMTTDLHFTLDLLERMPGLRLLADLSHYLVGREFAWPVSAQNHEQIHCILDHSWACHGRVASREQIQVEISFAHHGKWLDLFRDWWSYGFRSWRRRSGVDATFAFVCELGPQPYAISGADGNDLSDRWQESLLLRKIALELWSASAPRDTALARAP